jgi:hypothetical protein
MVTYFNKSDLISFGKYLLSKQRTESINANLVEGIPDDEDRILEVTHADFRNWKESKSNQSVSNRIRRIGI